MAHQWRRRNRRQVQLRRIAAHGAGPNVIVVEQVVARPGDADAVGGAVAPDVIQKAATAASNAARRSQTRVMVRLLPGLGRTGGGERRTRNDDRSTEDVDALFRSLSFIVPRSSFSPCFSRLAARLRVNLCVRLMPQAPRTPACRQSHLGGTRTAGIIGTTGQSR